MSKPAVIPQEAPFGSEAHLAKLRVACGPGRVWNKTATARWLNDRAPAVIAAARRVPGPFTPDVTQPGYWLKEHFPSLFARAHLRLAGLASDLDREAALPPEIIR